MRHASIYFMGSLRVSAISFLFFLFCLILLFSLVFVVFALFFVYRLSWELFRCSSDILLNASDTFCITQHVHFIPTVGVEKERRALIGSWRPTKKATRLTETALRATDPEPADSGQ